MRPYSVLLGALPLAVVAACATEAGVTIRAELMRLPEGSPLLNTQAAATVPPWTSNVTLTSVRTPITAISIHGPSISTGLYECPGATSAACLVELNGPALESLLPTGPEDVLLGTYDEVSVSYCVPGETGFASQLTGTAIISGITFYTRSSGNQLGVTGPAEPVNISFTGCGSRFAIVPPLVVTDTLTTVLLRLYFDMRDVAWAARSDATTNNLLTGPGCSGASATGFICAGYTTIFAVPGTALPAVERYRVNTTVTIGLIFDGTGRFVGGYNRRFYIEDTPYEPGIHGEGFYDIMTSSGPGTYRLTSSHGGNEFPAFQRASHSGTASVPVGGTPPVITVPYTAVRLP